MYLGYCWPLTGIWNYVQEMWGLTSPGPNCPQKSTFGYQNMSGNRTAPVINFTKGQRTMVMLLLEQWQMKLRILLFLIEHIHDLIYQQSCSSNRILLLWDLIINRNIETFVNIFISIMVNFQRDRGGESAGPGEYPIKGSVGKQPESQRATLPAYSFPMSTREGRDKVSVLLCASF